MSLFHRLSAAAFGVITALVVLELGLRCFESPDGVPLPNIAADRVDLPSLTRRQLEEGIAEAHFSEAGARLTGDPFIPGAPTVVVLGDSYVVARQVADDETIGAHIEREARQSGVPLNVRQYGWDGGSPARYILAAPLVLAKWHPSRVVIALADNDMDGNALLLAIPQLRVDSAGFAYPVGIPDSEPAPPPHVSALRRLLDIRLLLLERKLPLWANHTVPARATAVAPPAPGQLEALPRAVVRSLARAYGRRLMLVYLAEVSVTGGDSTTEIERKMFAACRADGVSCLTMRGAMRIARSRGLIARGFATTMIGEGHLNANGTQLVADEVWSAMRSTQVAAGSR